MSRFSVKANGAFVHEGGSFQLAAPGECCCDDGEPPGPFPGCWSCWPDSGSVLIVIEASANIKRYACCSGSLFQIAEYTVNVSGAFAPDFGFGCPGARGRFDDKLGVWGLHRTRSLPIGCVPGEWQETDFQYLTASIDYLCACTPSPVKRFIASMEISREPGGNDINIGLRSSGPNQISVGGALGDGGAGCGGGFTFNNVVSLVGGSQPSVSGSLSGSRNYTQGQCAGQICASWNVSASVGVLGLVEGFNTGCEPGQEPSAIVAPPPSPPMTMMQAPSGCCSGQVRTATRAQMRALGIS